MSSMRIHKDDSVIVTGGKDRGKSGKVIRTEPKKHRVFVEGLNIIKRHQRPRSLKDTQRGGKVGGVIEKEGPIHASNVMFLDPKQNRPTRVGVERPADGKRVRIARRSETRIVD